MSTDTTTPVAAPLEPAVKKRNWFARHKVWTVVLALVVIAIIGSAGSDEKTTTAPAATAPAAVKPAAAPKPAPVAKPAADTFGQGTHIVGSQVAPGRYQAAGGDLCYWARLDAQGGILGNHIGPGTALITVRATDAAVETQGCGTFTKVA